MVKEVIPNLDSSKASDPDYGVVVLKKLVPVVVLKNCEPDL